jgi:hypothetical protein
MAGPGYNEAPFPCARDAALHMKSKLPASTVAAALILCGCASASRIGLSGANSSSARPVPSPGSSYSTASVRAETGAGAYFGVAVIGFMAIGVQDANRRGYGPARQPPELAEGRAIVERDCSQPMAQPQANLRCK